MYTILEYISMAERKKNVFRRKDEERHISAPGWKTTYLAARIKIDVWRRSYTVCGGIRRSWSSHRHSQHYATKRISDIYCPNDFLFLNKLKINCAPKNSTIRWCELESGQYRYYIFEKIQAKSKTQLYELLSSKFVRWGQYYSDFILCYQNMC